MELHFLMLNEITPQVRSYVNFNQTRISPIIYKYIIIYQNVFFSSENFLPVIFQFLFSEFEIYRNDMYST